MSKKNHTPQRICDALMHFFFVLICLLFSQLILFCGFVISSGVNENNDSNDDNDDDSDNDDNTGDDRPIVMRISSTNV